MYHVNGRTLHQYKESYTTLIPSHASLISRTTLNTNLIGFPKMTEHRIFHVLLYYKKLRVKGIIDGTYPSWVNNDK